MPALSKLLSCAILIGLSVSLPALADDSERIQQLEQRLEEQRAIMERQQQMLETLRTEVERLKGEPLTISTPPSSDPSAGPKPATIASPPDQTAANQTSQDTIIYASEKKGALQLYGHLQLDVIHDFNRVDPDYAATLRPSAIPTVDGSFGQDGETRLSVKQTQLGLKGSLFTPVGEVNSWFEFDMFGTGSDTGQTTFNLRHAWVEIGRLGFGQTSSTFMDISIFPNTIDWWGPAGMVFNRNPQVRYTWTGKSSGSGTLNGGGNELAIALEQPNASFNTGIFGELSPVIDERASTRTEYPDLTAHWRSVHDWGHLQLAGVLRKLEFETICPGDPASCLSNNRPKDDETGWGVNFTGVLNTFGHDQLKFGVVYGEGIASFMNDGGVNLAPEDNAIEAVPILGTTLYYDRYWSPRWSSSLGVSVNDADVRNQQADSEFDRGSYASVNLLYTPYPDFIIGLEALYGEHKDVGGRTGEDFRTQLTFKHKFSTGF
ncbi:hypothetical protein G8770_14430 [Aestuariicella hydrocarbonica]|uniref:Porin n=1 Tax=Pseudomaricurvus hydrocarbonicus TaxID=1470433 RepID=A0A9E5MMA5_9GAMM|nr:DcaP family trimeric outer membrane transporter [Aestuariicella hydrocarbonica]NHO66743.1 hypothetical protein [Aestuariicella hydrocarbonica]